MARITEKPNPVMFANIQKAFGFRLLPHHGHDAVNAMKAMVDGRARVYILTEIAPALALTLAPPGESAAAGLPTTRALRPPSE
jgi:hypothetical protein